MSLKALQISIFFPFLLAALTEASASASKTFCGNQLPVTGIQNLPIASASGAEVHSWVDGTQVVLQLVNVSGKALTRISLLLDIKTKDTNAPIRIYYEAFSGQKSKSDLEDLLPFKSSFGESIWDKPIQPNERFTINPHSPVASLDCGKEVAVSLLRLRFGDGSMLLTNEATWTFDTEEISVSNSFTQHDLVAEDFALLRTKISERGQVTYQREKTADEPIEQAAVLAHVWMNPLDLNNKAVPTEKLLLVVNGPDCSEERVARIRAFLLEHGPLRVVARVGLQFEDSTSPPVQVLKWLDCDN
jgi:hypothetical protein